MAGSFNNAGTYLASAELSPFVHRDLHGDRQQEDSAGGPHSNVRLCVLATRAGDRLKQDHDLSSHELSEPPL
jgi:hypothetical protein